MLLDGKTVFITGATSGFGQACAKMCIDAGARVVATGRRKDRLEAFKQEYVTLSSSPLEGEGRVGGEALLAALKQTPPLNPLPQGKGKESSIHTVQLDVRDRDAVIAAVAGLPPEFSKIDVLVNNAGLALGIEPYESKPMCDIEQMVDTNIKGVLYCTQAILPGMIERNLGHIVTIGSVAGSYPYPGGNVYGASKAFVKQFSLNLRADLLSKNIRVTNIEPGMAETEFSLVRFHGDSTKAAPVYGGIEALSARDVADAILWCITRPPHVNVNRMEVMPTQQAFAGFNVCREQNK